MEWRNGDHLRLQFLQGFVESGEILRAGKYREISVAAKVGCAAEHARLAAHYRARTRCARIEERTLSIGFGVKRATKVEVSLPELLRLAPALKRCYRIGIRVGSCA